MRILITQIFVLLVVSLGSSAQSFNNKKVWKSLEQQTSLLLKDAREARTRQSVFPRTVSHDSLKLVNSNDWVSGFFPGILWFMYEYSGKEGWKISAQEFTNLMVKEPFNGNSHDVGFKVYNSYGNGYRLTNDTAYKKMIIRGAGTLAARFNPKVGCIKSWDINKWQCPVIIDNMMNLELLFAATRLTHDSSYYKIAVSHANTTMKNHFRANFSSYHVLDYDTLTGKVIARVTHQGYADESAWARGQAWALYGFTMCYRETRNKLYLQHAEKVAAFILNQNEHINDGIPYWDYSVPNPVSEPRDASAAAIMASALYELSHYSGNGKKYAKAADKIIATLTKNYRAEAGTTHGFLLLHSTGNKPAAGEIDVPIIYADYYYLEALLRASGNRKGNR